MGMEIVEEQNLETPKSESKLAWIIVGILTIIILIGAVLATIYGNFSGVDGATLKKEYLKKDEVGFSSLPKDIQQEYIKKANIEFFDLPKNIQEQYINKKMFSEQEEAQKREEMERSSKLLEAQSKIASLESDINALQKQIEAFELSKQELQKQEAKKEEAQKKEEVKEVTTKDKKDTTLSEFNPNFKLISQISCIDMGFGDYKVTDSCRDKVEKFFNTLKEKKLFFEVIPIVDEGDFEIIHKINDLNSKKEFLNGDKLKSLSLYANSGLGKFRAKEAGWLLRKRYGEDVKIQYVSYEIESKEKKRGFIIRAYK